MHRVPTDRSRRPGVSYVTYAHFSLPGTPLICMRTCSLATVLIPLVFILGSCDFADGEDEIVGSFEAETTGAIESTLAGEADSPVTGNLLQIRLHADDGRSETIVFSERRSVGEEDSERSEGSYRIRFQDARADDPLAAEVTFRLCSSASAEEPCNTQAYVGTDGVLEIDSIDDEEVRGTFSFHAVPLAAVDSEDPSNKIQVEGRFTAPFVVIEG